MKRQPCSANRVYKIRSFPYKPVKKLERSYEVYEDSTRNDKEAV